LLVINKVDLAEAVGADLEVMASDAVRSALSPHIHMVSILQKTASCNMLAHGTTKLSAMMQLNVYFSSLLSAPSTILRVHTQSAI